MSKPPRDEIRKPWHPPLDPDDVALWNELKKSVKRTRVEEDTELPVKPKAAAKAKPSKPETTNVKPSQKKTAVSTPASSFDRVSLRKIKTGRVKVDDSIDLHGLRQEAAHRAMEAFIINARERGYKLVLVVTGKGNRFGGSEGVLRKHVPRWLKEGDIARAILGFSTAAMQHGGEGAFYVRLRKRR